MTDANEPEDEIEEDARPMLPAVATDTIQEISDEAEDANALIEQRGITPTKLHALVERREFNRAKLMSHMAKTLMTDPATGEPRDAKWAQSRTGQNCMKLAMQASKAESDALARMTEASAARKYHMGVDPAGEAAARKTDAEVKDEDPRIRRMRELKKKSG